MKSEDDSNSTVHVLVREGGRLKRARVFVRSLSRDRVATVAVFILLLVTVVAVFAPWVAPYDPAEPDVNALIVGPSVQHPFGTDDLGRDLLSRVIWGSQVSLTVGLLATGLAAVAGVVSGLFAGYQGGWVDNLIMRAMDAMLFLPPLVLALALVAALGPNLQNAAIAIAVVYVPYFGRLVRGQVLSVKQQDFVLAARMVGVPLPRMLGIHILPNITAPIIVQVSFSVAYAIITEAGLSFLGLGAQPPTPTWEVLLRNGYTYMQEAPLLAVFPGLAILLTVLSLNLLGDALREAWDPRLRHASR